MQKTNNTNNSTNYFHMIIGLLGLALFAVILYKSIITAWNIFALLPKEVAVPIIAASVTILVSVLSLLISKYWERSREIELEHRNKKIPIYEEFITFIFGIIFSNQDGRKPVTHEEISIFFENFTPQLLLWGSDEVVKEYSKFRRDIKDINPENPKPETLFVVEKLLLALRKDTGHKNKNLIKGDILAFVINDIEKYV